MKTNRGSIEHFDSYGFVPDDELDLIDTNFRKINNEYHPHLSYLFYKSGKPIEYNDFRFQKWDKNIATCGFHCMNRLINSDLTIEQYIKQMKRLSKQEGKSFDKLVVELIK